MAKIKGIDTDHIDEAVINSHLERYGIACTGKLNRKLRILATHIADMKENMSEVEFDACKCSKCKGESPGILDECPFCGEGDTIDPEQVGQAAEGAEVTGGPGEEETPEPETPVEEETPEPTPEPEAEPDAAPKPPKRSSAKKAASKKKEPAKKATSKKAAKKAPKKKVLARKSKKKPSAKATKGTAIVVDTPKVPSKFGEIDLNQSVAKCRVFMSDATLECFRLGQELNHISDNNLYLLRRSEAGKSTYTSFKVFVRNEFGMSHQQAYNLMHVAKNFTEDQVREIGTTKLNLALKVPPEMREEILASASEGETMSSLSEKAQALLDKSTPAKKPPVGKGLTAIIAMGLMEEPMYKVPKSPAKVGAPTTPASNINDEPFAVFILEN